MKGYHQLQMEESKAKTAFMCHLGHYQYQCMPFDVPATYQRLMGELFGGKDWDFVFFYLDGLSINGGTLVMLVEGHY